MPPLRPTPPPWQQRCQTCCRALLRRLAGFAQWLPWALGALMFCVGAGAAEVPDGVAQQVAAGAAVDVIVEYDATAVELALARLRARVQFFGVLCVNSSPRCLVRVACSNLDARRSCAQCCVLTTLS